jgi:hypothetical protein
MNVAAGYNNKLYKIVSDDDAAAVGDPHLTLSSGSKTDMCCPGGVCKACDLADVDALLQEDEDAQGFEQVAEGRRCRQRDAKRAKFGSVDECAAAWAGEGFTYLGYWDETNPRASLRGLCLGWAADCSEMNVAPGYKNKLYKIVTNDDAAAVGDPHLTLSSGSKTDMCCAGGVCKACRN